MIVRGSTQEHIFILPFYLDMIEELFVTYSQNGKKVLEKKLSDGRLSTTNNSYIVTLSQEDTLSFTPSFLTNPQKVNLVVMQLRVKLVDGRVLASDIIKEKVYDVLKEGVI